MRHTGMKRRANAALMPSASDAGTGGEKDGTEMEMETPNSTPQTGNVGPGDAAPQQTNTSPVVPENPAQPVAPVESDEVRGLKAAAEAERKKRQDMETQLYQTQGLLAQVAAQMRAQPAPQQPQAPAQPDYLAELDDNDFLDPTRTRQGLNRAIHRVRQEAVAEANQTIEQLRFQMQYPDFNALVGSSDPMTGAFRPSELLQEALNENPTLQQQIGVASPQEKARIAYIAANYQKRLRDARTAQQQQRQTTHQQTQAAQLQNAANTAAAVTQPMSPSAVSGAPANSLEVDYRAMASNPQTAATFDALIQKALRGEFG